jgi:hypothetical protein
MPGKEISDFHKSDFTARDSIVADAYLNRQPKTMSYENPGHRGHG